MKIKIADFTFARILETGDLSRTVCGTPLYMAPEMILDHQYTDNGDLWSLGVIMFEMLFGHPPMRPNNIVELMDTIKQPISYPSQVILGSTTRLFLEGLLQRDPKRRFSWQMCFQHEYLDESLQETPLSAKLEEANRLKEKLQAQLKELGDRLIEHEVRENELKKQLDECTQENEELQRRRDQQQNELNTLFEMLPVRLGFTTD